MRLSYEELIAPSDVPITLSIGHIKNHSLREIFKHGINAFRLYQFYLQLKPFDYYTQLNKEEGSSYWDKLTEEQRNDISMYDVIITNDDVASTYEELFDFFFVERVVYIDKLFFLLKTDDYETKKENLEITEENFAGTIHPINFESVIDILRQVCCMESSDILEEKNPKFKNKRAKMIYEKLLKAKKEGMLASKTEQRNFNIANIISSTSAKSNNLNIIDIWNSTLFQLYDQFNKIQNNDIYYINSVRVAVWGDEKNKFDSTLWYKNNYNTK